MTALNIKDQILDKTILTLPLLGVFIPLILCLFTAITGSGIVMAISPEHARGKLGATIPAKDVSAYQAFGVELIASFLLVLTMLASIDANKDAARRDYGTAAALGVVVTLCYLIAVSQNNDFFFFFLIMLFLEH